MKTPVSTRSSRTAATPLRTASLFMLLCGFAVAPAAAQLIALTPSNVIGSSPSSNGDTTTYNWDSASSPYRASTIFSQQTGNVSGLAWTNNTWFPAASIGGLHATVDNRYVVIDLGAAYYLSSFELFNGIATYQHTGTFAIQASNSITAATNEGGFTRGQALSSPTALLGSTSLTFTNNQDPVTGQTFSVSSGTAYRYVEIDLLTAAGSLNGEVMDIRGSSLSEVRIYGSLTAIPEPSTYAAIMGLGTLGFVVWRRRRPVPRELSV